MATPASNAPLAGSQPVPVNAPKVDRPEIVEAAPEEHPTDSHELANADHEEKGAAQVDHGQTEVRDLGWNESPTEVPNPAVGGLPNEELWTLIRRFNNVCSAFLRFGPVVLKGCSKCIMSRLSLNHLLVDWTSILQAKRNFLQIN
jgi:hypothetical protein